MSSQNRGEISPLLQSFYSEFFGTFIPGFIAVFSVTSLCLITAIYCHIIRGVSGIQEFLSLAFESENGAILLSSWAIFGVVCAFSYAVGAIIYRRAPKIPDAIASYQQWFESSRSEQKALAVNFTRLINHGNCKIGISGWPFWRGEAIKAKFGSAIDYPYPHLRGFLAARGLNSLVLYVPWCADATDDLKGQARSKTRINTIKQLVLSCDRNLLSKDLMRNESHIRLLNSLWYTFRFLLEMLLLAIILQVVLLCRLAFSVDVSQGSITILFSTLNVAKFYSIVPLVIFSIAFFFIWLMKRNIVRCFHYVRTREIVMVLNAVELIRMKTNRLKEPQISAFFEDAEKQNTAFKIRYCTNCKYKSECPAF